MKKWGRVLVSVLLLVSVLCSGTVWAVQSPETGSGDPYAEFHEEIGKTVKEIYISSFLKLQTVQQDLASISTARTISSSNLKVELENRLQNIKKEQSETLKQALVSYGAVPIQDENDFAQLKSIPGDWQTGTDVFYWPETKEISFLTWFSGNSPILDMWGDYDLLSMEMKNDNGWYWNNISAMAVFNDKNMNPDNVFDVGEADKYHVISGNRVSARSDFWNGCIFNIQDETIQGMVFLNGLTGMIMQGWMQTRGSSRSNYVKADFEHNYRRHIFDAVVVSGSSITDFNLSVSYSNQGGSWFRTSGSRLAEIPAGY